MMRSAITFVAFAGVGLWIGAAGLAAQEEKPQKPKPATEKPADKGEPKGSDMGEEHGEWPVTPVGPEHKRLQDFAGTWKTETKMWHMPGMEPELSTGTSVGKMAVDGRALISEMRSVGATGTYEGCGVMTWNVEKQKYHGAWVDVFGRAGIDISWGTYDDATKTWTWEFQMMGPSGLAQARSVGKMLDKDHMSEEMFVPGPDGKEFKMLEIKSTRMK